MRPAVSGRLVSLALNCSESDTKLLVASAASSAYPCRLGGLCLCHLAFPGLGGHGLELPRGGHVGRDGSVLLLTVYRLGQGT
jgi:hypothetical protein